MTGVTVSLGFRKHGLITHSCTIRLVWCGVGWSEPSCNFGHVASQLTSFASFVISLPSLLENLFQRGKSDCPSEKLATVTFSRSCFRTLCAHATPRHSRMTQNAICTWWIAIQLQCTVLFLIPACPISRFSLLLHTVTAFNCSDRLRQGLGSGLMAFCNHSVTSVSVSCACNAIQTNEVSLCSFLIQYGSTKVLLSFLNATLQLQFREQLDMSRWQGGTQWQRVQESEQLHCTCS